MSRRHKLTNISDSPPQTDDVDFLSTSEEFYKKIDQQIEDETELFKEELEESLSNSPCYVTCGINDSGKKGSHSFFGRMVLTHEQRLKRKIRDSYFELLDNLHSNHADFCLDYVLQKRGLLRQPPEKKKKGRHTVEQFSTMITDDVVANWITMVYTKIFNESIVTTKNSLTGFLTTAYCAFSEYLRIDRVDEKVTCFFNILQTHLSEAKLISYSTLQKAIKWFRSYKQNDSVDDKAIREKRKFSRFRSLKHNILHTLQQLFPEYGPQLQLQ